tara:strand:- start:675 stop:1157 length:483 start_codon:yes stop_codon:yes gene_type:complete
MSLLKVNEIQNTSGNSDITNVGKILQFKYAEMTGGDFSMNSTTITDIPGLTNTMTLTSASNNTLVTVSVNPYMGGTGNGRYNLKIYRDSSVVYNEPHLIYRDGAFKAARSHHRYLDTGVSDTSSHTYKVSVVRLEGSMAFYLFHDSGAAEQSMVLEEITS